MPPAIPTASRAPAHTRTRAKKLLTTYGCQQQLRQKPPDSIKPGEVQAPLRGTRASAAASKATCLRPGARQLHPLFGLRGGRANR